MPYIAKDSRPPIELPLKEASHYIESAGDLNFAITTLCVNFLKKKGLRYVWLNTIVGVLECAKLEFYRKAAAPYEDTCIKKNGDVF